MDDAFHELAQSCTAAEAMEHTLQRAHAPPRGDNLVVRSLWLGEALSPLEHLAVKSWLAHGHEVSASCCLELCAVQSTVSTVSPLNWFVNCVFGLSCCGCDRDRGVVRWEALQRDVVGTVSVVSIYLREPSSVAIAIPRHCRIMVSFVYINC